MTIAWTALLMGLAGGAHCLAMCSAPCGALVGQGAGVADEQPVRWAPRGGAVRRGGAVAAPARVSSCRVGRGAGAVQA